MTKEEKIALFKAIISIIKVLIYKDSFYENKAFDEVTNLTNLIEKIKRE